MPSFDIVSEVNQVEVHNAPDQCNKEVTNRFDFKGSDARVELAELVLTVFADDDFKLGQVYEVLTAKFAKRGVDVRSLERGKPEKISGNKLKEEIKVKVGVDTELGKKIVRLLKDSKLKAQASIQGDAGCPKFRRKRLDSGFWRGFAGPGAVRHLQKRKVGLGNRGALGRIAPL